MDEQGALSSILPLCPVLFFFRGALSFAHSDQLTYPAMRFNQINEAFAAQADGRVPDFCCHLLCCLSRTDGMTSTLVEILDVRPQVDFWFTLNRTISLVPGGIKSVRFEPLCMRRALGFCLLHLVSVSKA